MVQKLFFCHRCNETAEHTSNSHHTFCHDAYVNKESGTQHRATRSNTSYNRRNPTQVAASANGATLESTTRAAQSSTALPTPTFSTTLTGAAVVEYHYVSSATKVAQNRTLTPLERGTSIEHGNSALHSPFAHLCLLFLLCVHFVSSALLGLDSMCWHHITGVRDGLINQHELSLIESTAFQTRVASGQSFSPRIIGDLPLGLTTTAGDQIQLVLTKVLYLEGFETLLSIGQWREESNAAPVPNFVWDEENLLLRFKTNECWLTIPHLLISRCYYLEAHIGHSTLGSVSAVMPHSRPVTSELAHTRLAFCGPTALHYTQQATMGLRLENDPLKLVTPITEAVLHGTAKRSTKSKSTTELSGGAHTRRHYTDERYDEMSIDTHGPFPPGYHNRFTYYLSMTSNWGYTQICCLESCTAEAHILALQEAFTRFGTPRHIRSDHSMILFKHDPTSRTRFQKFCQERDIALKISAPGSQWQNGRAERVGARALSERTTTMLFDAGLDVRWWPFCLLHATEVSNVLPVRRLAWKTPHEKHFGVRPFIGHYRRWGCPAFVTLTKGERDSPSPFSSRVARCIHLGNALDSTPGTYLLWSHDTSRFIKSRSIFFDETYRFVKKTSKGWEYDPSLLQSHYKPEHFLQEESDLARQYEDYIHKLNRAVVENNEKIDAPMLHSSPTVGEAKHLYGVKKDLRQVNADWTASLNARPIRNRYVAPAVSFDDTVSVNAAAVASQLQPGQFIDYHHHQIGDLGSGWMRRKLIRTIPKYSFVASPSSSSDVEWETEGVDLALSILSLSTTSVGDAKPSSWRSSYAPDEPQIFNQLQIVASSEPMHHSFSYIADPIIDAATTTLDTLTSLLTPIISRKPADFASASLQSFDPIPTRTITEVTLVSGITLTAASVWLAKSLALVRSETNYKSASSTSSSSSASSKSVIQPEPFTGTLDVDFDATGRKFRAFSDKFGFEKARAAYEREIAGIIKAGVISEPVFLPKGQLAPMATMIFTEKSDTTLKARLVYRGDLQVEGVNFDADALYAPVMDRTSMRMLLAIGAAYRAYIHTLDVNLAFLYGNMPDELYMRPPAGIKLPDGKVWRILKSLYGTRQAPAIWYSVLSSWFKSEGFTPSPSDACVFIKKCGASFIYVGVHVDDCLVVTNSLELLTEFKKSISARFSMKDLGELNGREFTGAYIEYDQIEGVLKMSCDRSVKKLLETFEFTKCHPHNTPLAKHTERDLTPASCSIAKNFAVLSGHANWLSILCRFDIAVASSFLASCKWEAPTVADVIDAKRLLRYLHFCLINYPRCGVVYMARLFRNALHAIVPITFADSDHANDPTKRSRSGQMIWMTGGPLYWKSGLQTTIALSSTYAEVIALSDVCKKLLWLVSLLVSLGFYLRRVPVFEDNLPAINILTTTKLSERSRYYEIRYLWTRELQSRGIISILPVGTKLNYADYFTKIFGYHECINFLARLRLPLSKEFFAGEETIQSSAFPVADNVNLIGDEEDTGHLALLATL